MGLEWPGKWTLGRVPALQLVRGGSRTAPAIFHVAQLVQFGPDSGTTGGVGEGLGLVCCTSLFGVCPSGAAGAGSCTGDGLLPLPIIRIRIAFGSTICFLLSLVIYAKNPGKTSPYT
jgi:hypothetical protein